MLSSTLEEPLASFCGLGLLVPCTVDSNYVERGMTVSERQPTQAGSSGLIIMKDDLSQLVHILGESESSIQLVENGGDDRIVIAVDCHARRGRMVEGTKYNINIMWGVPGHYEVCFWEGMSGAIELCGKRVACGLWELLLS